MRINRSYALAATAWLVLVVVGAVLVWAVISRAGQSVVSQPGPPIEQAGPFTSSPHKAQRPDRPKSPKASPRDHSKPGSGSPRGHSSPGPSGPGSPSSTPSSGPAPPAPTSGGAGPGPAPGPGPSSSPNNPPPASSPPPPQPSNPSQQHQGVRRSWQGSAGVVTVECRGASISLQGAQPNTGWSIDIDERGPEEVRVDFDSGERRTRVQAQCVGGSPRFSVDQGDD
jgi:hypothetical protein